MATHLYTPKTYVYAVNWQFYISPPSFSNESIREALEGVQMAVWQRQRSKLGNEYIIGYVKFPTRRSEYQCRKLLCADWQCARSPKATIRFVSKPDLCIDQVQYINQDKVRRSNDSQAIGAGDDMQSMLVIRRSNK